MNPSINPIKLRIAVAADAPAISQLINSLMPFMTLWPDARGAEKFVESMAAPAIASYVTAPDYHYQLGYVGDELVGVIAVREQRHVFHLFVAAKYHRQGHARQLWHAARDAALQAGNRAGFTVNAARVAVPVYQRFGFVITDALVEEHGIAYQPMRLASPA